jgi:UDP-N-acetylglucosamine diphosphorylase/glucosamine-1-phosphate N-acetyltransferase
MLNLVLFDSQYRDNLLPLTFTRPVCDIRVGILTIREKWEKHLNAKVSCFTQDYLQEKYNTSVEDDNIIINASALPTSDLVKEIKSLDKKQAIISNEMLIAARVSKTEILDLDEVSGTLETREFNGEIKLLTNTWEIFSFNDSEIRNDFELLTQNRKSQELSNTVNVLGGENIFVEEGFKGEFITLNANEGPIYLGKDSEIMEGSTVRGPFALCEHSALKLNTKIYGATTIGPHCKVGGEVNNSVFFGYANKAHDGFLGNAVIGEWCNLGADSNNSNLKNNYAEVRIWNYPTERFAKTGLQFCGLIMGDHSKCGINTMFNTGTVVGVSANIFGSGFPRNFIPSYSWGGASGFEEYGLKKALTVAKAVFERRKKTLNETEGNILAKVFELTAKYRNF